MLERNQRSISQETFSKIKSSNELQINIQQPVNKSNTSQLSSSIQEQNRSELSIHDKINMLNESIRTSQKNERFFQENMTLRQRLHHTQEALQDANIKCSLWDKFKLTIQGLNKDYLHLKSIQNNCSDGTILKEFISVLKQILERMQISQKIQKSHSIQSKRKDTQYYELYEKEKKQNYEYQQHIITLNNELDILQEENQKLKDKLKSSSLRSSDIMGSDGKILSGNQKELYEELSILKQQNGYLLEHKSTLQQQLDAEREKLKQIVDSLDQYESQIKRGELELKKRNKELQTEVQVSRDIEKTLKAQLQESIEQNNALRLQCQRLTILLKSQIQNDKQCNIENNQNVLQSREYLQLAGRNQTLYQKYQKVKAQNETLGEQKEKLGQEMQEIEQLSKEMEYNYEVKIDDLRKQYQGELETIISNYNQKMLSLSQQKSLCQSQAQKQRLCMVQKLDSLQKSTSSKDLDKQQLVSQYEKRIVDYRQEIARCHQQLKQRQTTIEDLKQQVSIMSLQIQRQQCQQSNSQKEMQEIYKTKIKILQVEAQQMVKTNQQLIQQIKNLRQHITTLTAQLNEQDDTIQKYKSQLVKKDQLLINLSQTNKGKDDNAEQHVNITQLIKQLQQSNQLNQQLKKTFDQNQQSNAILKANIAEWSNKCSSLINQNHNLQLQRDSLKTQLQNETSLTKYQLQKQQLSAKIQNSSSLEQINQTLKVNNQQLTQEVNHLHQQLTELKQKMSIQTTAKKSLDLKEPQFQNPDSLQNMDGLMVQSLKEQIQNLLEQNRVLEDENNKFRQEIAQSQQQVHQIQRYVKLISLQNKKIPHYEQDLSKQRLKSEKLKLKLTQQKEKFLSIMEKNQLLHEQLLKKTERNQLLLKQNILIQKEETQKLQNLISKYHSTFMSPNQTRQPSIHA